MRSAVWVLVMSAMASPTVLGKELPQFADAPLRAVQFVDENEGWAVGDDGVVLHTIDGGQNWERQPTGVRASLRSLHFLDPFTGFVVGRESLPFGAASAGVILYTSDGGLKWQRASVGELPGLQRVKFLNARVGFVVGEGSDQLPSGVFFTGDAGATWRPLPGPRAPGWLAADFTTPPSPPYQGGDRGGVGVLAGLWGTLSAVRNKELLPAEADSLEGRAVRSVHLLGRSAWAVGDGGLLLVSEDTAGKRWGHADLQLPPEVRRAWDFHALHFVGDHGWVVGRPGSVVLHTWDRGKSWQAQSTGQPLPLHGVFFLNEKRGWAVGELGAVLATQDGGQSWKVQRRGGHRLAVLVITSQPQHLAPGLLAQVGGGDQGYLCGALSVASRDPASAAPGNAGEAMRLHEAVRLSGGCAGEVLWQFPLPQHLANASAADLTKLWGKSQDEARGLEELERQVVLALRIWRPDVVVTDNPDPRSSTGQLGALVSLVTKKAFEQAGKPDVHPDQIGKLDLQPWNASKLYGRWDAAEGAQVSLDLDLTSMELEGTANDCAAAGWNLLCAKPLPPPTQVHYRLLASRLEHAEGHKWFLQGITLGQGGQARRQAAPPDPERESRWAQIEKAVKQRRDFQAVARLSLQEPPQARQMLATLERSVAGLTEDQAGDSAFALGHLYANAGQWLMAKEVFLFLVDRYPTQRTAPEACRWLIRHGASSEARRREELNHFVATRSYEFVPNRARPPVSDKDDDGKPASYAAVRKRMDSALLRRQGDVRGWYRRSLAVGDILAAFGPIQYGAPDIQFCLQAARQNLGEFEDARLWYTQFKTQQHSGPWYEAASTELWLANRQGTPAKPVTQCPLVEAPPYLDGRLDDPCWRASKPIALKNAVGQTAGDHPTEAWLAFDANYLYLALRCQHPEGRQALPVKPRQRDADLRGFDRVSLLLDLDRDYSTCFHLQVDQRGCVCEDCWGDRTWDPKWFVAVHSETNAWQIEAAIPLQELVSEPLKPGRCWAANVVRTIPGKGVQAYSIPADVLPRPEGMGLIQFGDADSIRPNPPRKMTTAEAGVKNR
jgi:photosystem II stability/assembly factor-like uncharacterized protein